MKSALFVSLLLAASTSAAPTLQIRAAGFDFSKEKVRGVNAGGWLVLEPWITPSLWSQWNSNPTSGPVDEYHLCQTLGKSACLSRLQQHWNTWFTQKDFQDMKAVGLNTVRIPIGYWAFQLNPGDPYVQGQEAFLDKAIGWARAAGLKVWIDLHGAPGSQNGFDNSGLRDQIGWQQGNTVQQTIAVIRKIADKYAKPEYQDTVVVIELLNEPLGVSLNLDVLRQFYYDGFGNVREVSGTWIAISDAFQQVPYWNGVLSSPGNNVIVDHHHYQVFSQDQVARDLGGQIGAACGARGETEGSDKYVVVGEWSGAMTDCARWLNGFNRGARYDGTYQSSQKYGDCGSKGNINAMSAADKENLRKYIEAQLDSFEKSNGWIFWTWKAEEGNMNDDWNYSKLVSHGIFPKPPTARKYAGVCG
ncbi:hypothetical protein ABW19_dt0203857 [Dactylella cylindrospora]|nr:hypothetical protein ABW19_dt0203857 [Dactylella cylindrospora]